jgi:hypothetical protein
MLLVAITGANLEVDQISVQSSHLFSTQQPLKTW